MERYLHWYIGNLNILTNTYTTAPTTKSSMFNTAYSIITNEDDLHKDNASIKPVSKENGYQESIISKIFKRITNNHTLPQLQQLTQATDIQEDQNEYKFTVLQTY